MKQILLFIILIGISIETTTYDKQAFTKFSYTQSGFNCQNGFTRTSTITFTSAFANVPQIIYYSNTLDYNFSNRNSVVIEILSVTLTQFSIKITCSNNKINTFSVIWIAIDDSRFQVITESNIAPFTSKQYPISNPNLKKAIVSILCFTYTGSFNIDLSITELTQNYVTIGMNSAYQNLISLSYQIILGTDEVLNLLDKISTSSAYTSPTFTTQANSYFQIAFNKFTTSLLSIRLSISVTESSNSISYSASTWNTNTYPTNTIQPFFLKYIQEQYFLAMECFTARISKLFDITADQKPDFEIKILELNKVYSSATTESIVIDESMQLININIYYKCPSNNKKLRGQLNKCNNCSGNSKIHKLNHYCHGSINSIYVYAKYSAQANYKQIQITITNNSINIVQKLINKTITEQNILKVEFIDT